MRVPQKNVKSTKQMDRTSARQEVAFQNFENDIPFEAKISYDFPFDPIFDPRKSLTNRYTQIIRWAASALIIVVLPGFPGPARVIKVSAQWVHPQRNL